MSGNSNGLGRVGAGDMVRLLPGLGDRPTPGGPPGGWEAHDREQLRLAQEEVRADQIAARLAVLMAGRSRRYAGNWPLPPEEAPKMAAWTAELAATGEPGFLWLVGTSGSGKTSAAWSAIEAAVRAGWAGTAEVVKSAVVLEALAPPVDTAARARWAQVDLLVLDDFGKNGTSAWEQGQLHWILNERWEADRPLIITAEVKIQQCLDPADWSRLNEMITVVHMGNTDHRRRS